MYSMVLVVAMTGGADVPQGHFGKGNGCVGGCVGGYAAPAASAECCPAPAPVAYTGCNGCGGGYGGGKCGFCGFGSKLKGCFSCFGKGNGCGGGCGGYMAGSVGYGAGPVMAAPAPGCGQTVIPPAGGAVYPGGVYQPQPGGVYVPGGAYPPGTVITQPGTVITQPGTVITQPGTTTVQPGTTTTTTTPRKDMPKVEEKKK